ncbi:MAG: hypothetical protein A2W05_11310 [Candidatus Schekmanbacteria bacterium RBG_16_38_10]|uniref:Methylene-tetrahydrofolate reductase C-terminal-like domain-containing protein n=1 Tax=Candidatus Schekmanbacteria bacterium RBG_16_38_10 TaxID=1817879 RepID=A0A1F7S1V6_9BACT|nr:MAG: hypothetical protein A2W05_11310 [Candidatus Schekmanbacteria bacterium RBG_16_38_10]
MIVGERKPIKEILKMIEGYERILIVGCGTCVAVCFAGGEKQVKILASALKISRNIQGKKIVIEEMTVERQCEKEFVDELKNLIPSSDIIISLACGIGAQTLTELFPEKITLPGLNTTFIGAPVVHGIWEERCRSCGDCSLDLSGGICPVSRCSKSLLNGPCGGSKNGKCEVNSEIDCAWQLIYNRLKKIGKINLMTEIIPPKKRSLIDNGIPRKIIREDLMI